MEKEFTYEQKETYTHEDVQGILKGHRGYLKVDELKEANGKLATELKPYKEKARASHIASLIPNTANKDMASDIILLSKINDDDDDEAIKNKLAETIKNREYLQVKVNDKESIPVKTKIEKKEKPKKTEKEYRFVK